MTTLSPSLLRGITWKHTRGLLPMLATAQRFEEMHPGVRISWETRSLQSFADEPIEMLAQRYDLMVIDHPSCGHAATGGFLMPLDEVIPASFLHDQEQHSTGQSYFSYDYGGHLWALPIDTATPISMYRHDLLRMAGHALPGTWEEMIKLARKGFVIVPGLAIDSLMNFFMLSLALGEEPFIAEDYVVSEPVGIEAMRRLRELLQLCPAECMEANPIAIWNKLAQSKHAAYCPFAYGYSNYSRRGYSENLVEAGDLVTFNGAPLRSTLGGAGLAISRHCKELTTAVAYAQYVSAERCQKTLYFDSGGQPGHRAAWLDAEVNRRSNGFFERTLPALDRAWVRPRFDGYLDFQTKAGELLHSYLRLGGNESEVVAAMNDELHIARQSRGNGTE
jgi:multiple sugar transport system substrate-binding protein